MKYREKSSWQKPDECSAMNEFDHALPTLSRHTQLAVNRCRMGKSVYAARNGMAANERAAIILERLTSEHRLVCAGQKKM